MCMDNLAKDCIRMKKLGYGCHYGKYKADHPQPIPHRELFAFEEEETAICPTCGKEFIPKSPRQVYCDAVCQSRRQYQKVKEARGDPEKANCPVCGREFLMRWGRKYCGETCRRWQNQMDRRERNGN